MNTTDTVTTLLRVNDRHDRDQASDRVSRYGAYLRDRATRFLDPWDDRPTTDPALFAAVAFEIGCSPIMAPPYITTHPRVAAVGVHCDDDARRAIRLDLALDLPTDLRHALPGGCQGWQRDYHGGFYPPDNNDRPAATGVLTVRVPFPPADHLPAVFYDQHDNPHVPTAQTAVRVLVAHINTELADMLAAVTGRQR